MARRRFLAGSVGLGALWAASVGGSSRAAPAPTGKLRAAVIGHTGRGNYGHEHDVIFNDYEHIQVAAVADPDAAGRASAAARCRALRQYADYHQMLVQEKPQLVCVAPRWTDQHHAMALAALQAGAHVYLEKPIAQTLAQADELLATAARAGLKIAVAHQMRLAPNVVALQRAVAAGLLGDLLEIRAHGKQDARAGGEDLIVLGVHLFDLMRLFAGDALWCTARVTQSQHDIGLDDAHAATEDIGPVAGDEIQAQFAFPSGVNATFISRAKHRAVAGHWGLELVGSKARARILADIFPAVLLAEEGDWQPAGKTTAWRPWKDDPTLNASTQERSVRRANRRVVDDWLAAISENREPVCSGRNGMKALEMALAVFQAGLSADRVKLPLAERGHPLTAKA